MQPRSETLTLTLTDNQSRLIAAFNDAISRNDITNIIETFEQLQTLPDDSHPIRTIALQNDGYDTIKRCIDMIGQAVRFNVKKYVAEKMKEQVSALDLSLEQLLVGNQSAPLEIIDFNLLQVAAVHIYLQMMASVYRHALWVYAYKNNTDNVNGLINGYEKIFRDYEKSKAAAMKNYIPTYGSHEDCKVYAILENYKLSIINFMKLTNLTQLKDISIYTGVAKGYLDGEHYSALLTSPHIRHETNFLIVKTLVEKKKFTDMMDFIKKYETTGLLLVAFEVCDQAKATDQIRLLCNQFAMDVHYLKYAAKAGSVSSVTNCLARFIGQYGTNQYLIDASAGYKLGGFLLESRKIWALDALFICTKYDSERPTKIFEQIKNYGVDDIDLKINLLVDCLYKNTLLGAVFWGDRYTSSIFDNSYSKDSTPTLKRGVLNQVLSELVKLGVDIAKLPGCSAYSPGLFAKYPSKVDLEGKMPPSVIPMVDVVVSKVAMKSSDAIFGL